MSTTNRSMRKPSYLFIFEDEQKAKLFYQFASSQQNATLVQFPIDSDRRGSRDYKRVLVTATGSTFFDVVLHDLLVSKAEELHGQYLPKV